MTKSSNQAGLVHSKINEVQTCVMMWSQRYRSSVVSDSGVDKEVMSIKDGCDMTRFVVDQ